jgi:hypothetical protein
VILKRKEINEEAKDEERFDELVDVTERVYWMTLF